MSLPVIAPQQNSNVHDLQLGLRPGVMTTLSKGKCYVLVEHLARLEQCGYDFDALHIALEACASDTW